MIIDLYMWNRRHRLSLAMIVVLPMVILTVAPARGADEARTLPVSLRVLSYDAKLDSILLSGDIANTLAQPLQAVRGTLSLQRAGSEAPMRLAFSHQSRRAIYPEEYGVWSVWIDVDPATPVHGELKNLAVSDVIPTLHVGRVLYADGSQEVFTQ